MTFKPRLVTNDFCYSYNNVIPVSPLVDEFEKPLDSDSIWSFDVAGSYPEKRTRKDLEYDKSEDINEYLGNGRNSANFKCLVRRGSAESEQNWSMVSRSLISPICYSEVGSESIPSDYCEFDEKYAIMLLKKFQKMDEFNEWDLIVDKSMYSIWIAQDGSYFNRELPFIHSQTNFDSKYSFLSIINAVNDPVLRKKWDKNIHKIKVDEDNSLVHTTYKKALMQYAARDFVEKKLTFQSISEDNTDIFFILSQSIEDDSDFPIKEGVIRWKCLFHLIVFESLKDGSTLMQSFTQYDLIDSDRNLVPNSL